jgi:phenylacetyl-CoA:acceptor oxidoreductase subunit 2
MSPNGRPEGESAPKRASAEVNPVSRDAPPYGPNPWQQAHWDARAAANFICGGMGSGLVAVAAISGAQGTSQAASLVVGVVLVAVGLASVFAELGRPLRAANVIRNPRTSWMSREALVAPAMIACALAAAAGHAALAYVAAALALAFVYCQGRMLHAARGIPAWRAPLVPALLVTTGLAEGAGLFLVVAAAFGARAAWPLGLLAVLVVARWLVFRRYRASLGAALAPRAAAALDGSGRWLAWMGTVAPLALAVAAVPASGASTWLAATAGLAAAFAGAALKRTLMLAAGHNQGFAIAHLPVRGARS